MLTHKECDHLRKAGVWYQFVMLPSSYTIHLKVELTFFKSCFMLDCVPDWWAGVLFWANPTNFLMVLMRRFCVIEYFHFVVKRVRFMKEIISTIPKLISRFSKKTDALKFLIYQARVRCLVSRRRLLDRPEKMHWAVKSQAPIWVLSILKVE